MARAKRENRAGVYHLVNRGVGLREVFLCEEDKLFFIQLICDVALEFDYIIHAYSLLDNGYNILMETKKNNLSMIMKLLNATYAKYFNKKYGRRGYLWEGRFKSWFIVNELLILDIVAYIEHLPVYVGMAKSKESSYYTSYRQFIGLDQRLPCLSESIIFKTFNDIEKIKSFLNKPVEINYINTLHEKLKKQNKRMIQKRKILTPLKKEYFMGLSKKDRNLKIYKYYKEGYSQSNIGKVLGVSQQAVHYIIKKIKQ